MHSPVDLSYLLSNFSLSESVPLVRLHDTSGFGVPVTLALNTAVLPEDQKEQHSFHTEFFLRECNEFTEVYRPTMARPTF